MAVIKAISSKASLSRIINYVTNDNKTDDSLVTGKDCLAESSLEEMQYVKVLYHKTDGRQYIHLIQSFSPEDKVTKEQIHNLGLKLAERFTGHQVLVATHIDREHIHNHLVVNSVNFEDGKKIQMSKKDLQDIKDFSDNLCREIGLSVIEKTEKSNYMNTKQYGVAQRGDSWKFKLINAIDNSIQNSNTKDEFIRSMNKLGYQVNWTDTRKYITYTTPEGMKCRDNKLFDSKYLKGEMENGFTGIKREESDSKTARDTETSNQHGILSDRSSSNRENVQVGTRNKSGYNGYIKCSKGAEGRLLGLAKGSAGKNESSIKKYYSRGNSLYDGHFKANEGRTEQTGAEAKNKTRDNRVSDGFLGILSILPSQRVNERPKSNVKRLKRNLSKQAMKEYAKNKANASGFNWEEDEEEEF